jgi:hypothetical protein
MLKSKPNLSALVTPVMWYKSQTLIFSPTTRRENNTIKHTLENVEAVKVVINVVNYDIVQQKMSLAKYGISRRCK